MFFLPVKFHYHFTDQAHDQQEFPEQQFKYQFINENYVNPSGRVVRTQATQF